MKNAIETTIDAAGRIGVPKTLRDELRLAAGQRLSLWVNQGVLEVEPVAEPVSIRKRGRFFVAGAPGRTKLTTEAVTRTRSKLRDEK